MSHAGKIFAVAVLVALAWAGAPVVDAQPPIRIGASLSQTGALAALGQPLLRGYQLCVKHMNERGGVLGRKLKLVVYNDGSDAATAVRLYEKTHHAGQGGSGARAVQLADRLRRGRRDREAQDADGGTRGGR